MSVFILLAAKIWHFPQHHRVSVRVQRVLPKRYNYIITHAIRLLKGMSTDKPLTARFIDVT